jgi:cytoskeleton protein RodZ
METESDTPKEVEQAHEAELGARLTRARAELEISLEKAAASLKVDVAVLNNLEAENFDALGAPVFVRGHLRKYARILNLPEQELLDAYEVKTGDNRVDLSHPILRETVAMSRYRRKFSLGLIFLVIMLVVVLGAAVFWWFQIREMDVLHDSEIVKRSQSQGLAVEGGGTVSLALPGAGLVSESSEASAPVQLPLESENQVEPTGQAVNIEPEPEPAPVQAEESAPVVIPEATVAEETVGQQVLLVLTFEEDSWAEIQDGNRKRVLYGLFRAGTRRELNVPAPVSIYLGHLQGVSISVDGEAYAVPSGQRTGNTARFVVDPSL